MFSSWKHQQPINPTNPWQSIEDLVLRVSKLDEARSKLLEAGKVADTEIAKLDAIIDDMENQQLDRQWSRKKNINNQQKMAVCGLVIAGLSVGNWFASFWFECFSSWMLGSYSVKVVFGVWRDFSKERDPIWRIQGFWTQCQTSMWCILPPSASYKVVVSKLSILTLILHCSWEWWCCILLPSMRGSGVVFPGWFSWSFQWFSLGL